MFPILDHSLPFPGPLAPARAFVAVAKKSKKQSLI